MILVSVSDAAAIAKVSQRTIRRWLNSGKLTPHNHGKVDAAELQTAQTRVKPCGPLALLDKLSYYD